MSTTSEYSGVVINQNATPVEAITSINWHFQNFKLPTNYRLGSEPGQHQFPALSGFQILAEIYANKQTKVEVKYSLEYHEFGAGWKRVAEGTVVGAHASGEKVWVDVFFEEPVSVTEAMAEAEFRIGFSGNTWVGKWWTVPALPQQPSSYYPAIFPVPINPPVEALTTTFNYRILALTADSGIDFLGNPYRSIAVQKELSNTSTTHPKKGAWRSSPQPSKFAVVSNYFDMRYNPGDHYGAINFVTDPSFEYDKIGSKPYGWEEFIGEEGTAGTVEVSNKWASSGTQSLRAKSGNLTNSTMNWMWGVETTVPIKNTGLHYELKLRVNITKLPASGKVTVIFTYLNSSHEELGGGLYNLTTVGEHEVRLNVEFNTAKTEKTAAYVFVQVLAKSANGEYEWYVDEVCVVTEKGKIRKGLHYFDGDTAESVWLGPPGKSPSAEIAPGTPEEGVVIDGIMLDPQTANVAFNVYYSSEGDAGHSTEEWEQKLWTRIPRSYLATQRQTYMFPAPVTTKYIKIEYSHLQPQAYNPGDFQKPITYKKFPKWVASFFLNQLSSPAFVASRVGVSYDALQFAYEYYLDDLQERPAAPLVPTHEGEEQLKRFFNQSDAANLVDAQTLEKINLSLNTYTSPPASQAHPSLLGTQVKRVAELQTNYPVEEFSNQENRNLLSVSSLNRENILIEESTPIMYFYLTCRHAYKELTASLEYNRAYFVGINEIAFIRNSYGTEADGEVYIESGTDTENLEINDFVINNDGSWSTF